MNILYDNHNHEMINEWFESDKQEMIDTIDHKKWLVLRLNKHSHNPTMRRILMAHLNDINEHIENLKKDFIKNYGSTYKLLFAGAEEKITG